MTSHKSRLLRFENPVYESINSCFMLRYFAVFVLILTLKLPVLSFILNLTTATHCTIILHSLR